MKSRMVQIGLVLGSVALVTGATCGDISTAPEQTVLGCIVRAVDPAKWPATASLDIDKPVSCPFRIAYAGRIVNFAADGRVPQSEIWNNFVRVDFVDAEGTYHGYSITSGVWGFSGSDYTVDITGTYPAGWAGFFGNHTDTAATFISSKTYGTIRANGLLKYEWGEENEGRMVAPSQLMPYTNFQVEGYVRDPDGVGPISYRWLVNGQDIGVNAPSFTYNSGPMGTVHYVQMEATDLGNGHVSTAFADVQTKNCDTPGCSDQ